MLKIRVAMIVLLAVGLYQVQCSWPSSARVGSSSASAMLLDYKYQKFGCFPHMLGVPDEVLRSGMPPHLSKNQPGLHYT